MADGAEAQGDAGAFDARIDALLALARTYARGLLALTIVVAALPPLFTYRRRRRRRDSPEKEP